MFTLRNDVISNFGKTAQDSNKVNCRLKAANNINESCKFSSLIIDDIAFREYCFDDYVLSIKILTKRFQHKL